ncbi:MAG: hypothetical protein LH610_00745 [Sphingomonas bacterium]|nr:hypothetical protein [Sphingomonas bacterium]
MVHFAPQVGGRKVIATTAAALIANARQDVVSNFMRANAVSKEAAIPYAPDRSVRLRQFERLREAGVIHTADGDRYWIDSPRYDDWSRSRRHRLILAIGGVALLVAIAGWIAGIGR